MKLKNILCPVDYDLSTEAVLTFASRLAKEHHGTVSVLHVVKEPFEPSEVPVAPDLPEWERDAHRELETVVDKFLGEGHAHKLLVKRGDPAAAIAGAAEELHADVIVMATHARSGLAHLALGSVVEKVVRESRVPVLTVRTHHA
jgi:universal stress protein A